MFESKKSNLSQGKNKRRMTEEGAEIHAVTASFYIGIPYIIGMVKLLKVFDYEVS